jgi:predicted  nucleic acid-binding Zn-ribbon protein
MSKPAYEPPSEFMFNVVLDALNFANNLAKSKQDEVKELKLQVKEDNTTIVELLNEKNELIEENCVFKERIHELRDQINDLKSGLNIIDPHGVLRSECP